MTQTPRHLPVLSRHAHLDPSDGACLMEYVSVLAGEPFGDAPACTHPVLAAIARLVNDASTDAGRPRLAVLAPDLAATGPGRGSGGDGGVLDAELVAAAVGAAAEHTGHPRLVRLGRRAYHRRDLAREQAAAGPPARTWHRLYAAAWRRGPAMHALATAAAVCSGLPGTDRDATLRAMLTAALDAWYTRRHPTRRVTDLSGQRG